jgi:serine/threonine-protein kinase
MDNTNGPDSDLATRVGDPKLTSRFVFKRSLGVGGMGEVYLAEDSSLRRPVAIKTIRPDLARDPEVRKRIERECLLHAKVGPHPHIVTLFDKLDEDGRLNLVMEFVEGETLQAMLERHHKEGTIPPLGEAIAIASQVLDALGRIHAQGIVHRDIKPANIILTRDDSGAVCAKLMDFGIARGQDDEFASRLTQEGGSGPGTPLYMAPEQIDPQTFGAISPATDVYSMGVMLYQMTSGEPPFTGSITQIFNGHLRAAPPNLRERARGRVPEMLAEIVECALAKNAASRFPTAKAFRDELLHVAPSAADACSPASTMPSRASSATADSARTLRANEASLAANAASTQYSGSSFRAGSTRRGGRGILLWVVLVIILAVVGAAAWFVVPGLLKGKDEPKPSEMVPDTVVPATAQQPALPAAPAPAVPPAAPTPAGNDLPLGFGPSAATPNAAPAPTPAPAPQNAGSSASATDILNQGLATRPPEPEPPAPAPSAPIAAAVTKPQEPPKTEKPKPAKTSPAKSETQTTTKAAEPAKASEPAKTDAPADSGNAWSNVKADSVEAHKVK